MKTICNAAFHNGTVATADAAIQFIPSALTCQCQQGFEKRYKRKGDQK